MMMTFNLKQLRELAQVTADYEGNDEDEELCVSLADGHSGFGLYVWSPEYPDEGSIFLGGAV